MSDIPDSLEDFLGDVSEQTPSDDGFFENVTYETDINADPMPDPEKPFADSTQQVGDGNCFVCGTPTFRPPGLTKAGYKKRIPKYCDMHTPNLRLQGRRFGTRRMGSKPAQSSQGESQLQNIQDELADDIRLLATLAGPLLPVTGMYLYEQSDPFTIAIVKLAKNNQTALRILHRVASVAPVYTVAETLAGTAYAVQVDMKGADPHNTVARRLKVERAYEIVYPNEDTGSSSEGFSSPPRYSVVQ